MDAEELTALIADAQAKRAAQARQQKVPICIPDESPSSGEEIRKLYAEILQLDNQRFLLTTTAVVLSGTVAGWVTTVLLRAGANTNSDQGGPILIPLAGALLLLPVLVTLFRFQLSKAATIRWLAAYLVLQGSKWELTWYAFRKSRGNASPQGSKLQLAWNAFLDACESFRNGRRENSSSQGVGSQFTRGELPFYQIHRMNSETFLIVLGVSSVYLLALQVLVVVSSSVSVGFWILLLLCFCWVVYAIVAAISCLQMWHRSHQILDTDESAYIREWVQAVRCGVEYRNEWRSN